MVARVLGPSVSKVSLTSCSGFRIGENERDLLVLVLPG